MSARSEWDSGTHEGNAGCFRDSYLSYYNTHRNRLSDSDTVRQINKQPEQ